MSAGSRELDKRENSTRSKEGRPSIKYYHLTTSNLDLSIVPEGMKYAKIAKECRGQSLSSNVNYAIRMGYRPVPKERHPELCLGDDLMVSMGIETGKESYITDREHILMEIPQERYNEIELEIRKNTEMNTKFANELGDNKMHDDPHVYTTRPQARYESNGVYVQNPRKTAFGHDIIS